MNLMNLASIGQRIRARREYLRMTQQEVADKISTSRSNYTKYEAGDVDLNITTLQAIARELEVSVSYLLDEEYDFNQDDAPIEAQLKTLPPELQDAARAGARAMIQSLHEQHRRNQTNYGRKAE